MKNISKALPIIPVLCVSFGCTSRTSDYNFGIKISEQPQYFSEYYRHKNPEYANTYKNINIYRDSLNIELKNDEQYPIDIEFLVDANNHDIRVYPTVDDEKYFLTTMAIGFTNQVQIKQELTVDGESLKHIAKYICVYDKEKNYYVPSLVSDDEYLSNAKSYRVVYVYKFPKGRYLKDLRKFWFKFGNLKVKFKVKDKDDRNESLDFKLYWYRRSSLWERILNVT